jgi:ABC-type Fe3+ transport system substrate-binding protein
MATQEFITKRDEAFELLIEVIKLANNPENHDALADLTHWLLGDAGQKLASACEKAGTTSSGIKYSSIKPLTAYQEKCKEQAMS